jgi:hypothetical protein
MKMLLLCQSSSKGFSLLLVFRSIVALYSLLRLSHRTPSLFWDYAYFMFIVCNNIHNPEIAVAFRAVNLIHAVHSRANDSSNLGSLCFEEIGMNFHGYEWIVRKQNKEETYNVYDLVQTSRSLQHH